MRLQIRDTATDTEAACILVHLSNGLTTRHAYVSYGTGIVVGVAFLLCLIHSFYPMSSRWSDPDYRFFNLVFWLQHMVMSGMFSLSKCTSYLRRTSCSFWMCRLPRSISSIHPQLCLHLRAHRFRLHREHSTWHSTRYWRRSRGCDGCS